MCGFGLAEEACPHAEVAEVVWLKKISGEIFIENDGCWPVELKGSEGVFFLHHVRFTERSVGRGHVFDSYRKQLGEVAHATSASAGAGDRARQARLMLESLERAISGI